MRICAIVGHMRVACTCVREERERKRKKGIVARKREEAKRRKGEGVIFNVRACEDILMKWKKKKKKIREDRLRNYRLCTTLIEKPASDDVQESPRGC